MIAALVLTVAGATLVGLIEWARMAIPQARTRQALARIGRHR